jgi:hypothetical protein
MSETYLTADGQTLRRGSTIVTVKYKADSELCKSKEDHEIWIVTTLCGDMVRAKCMDAENWRQAFFIRNMETIEIKS